MLLVTSLTHRYFDSGTMKYQMSVFFSISPLQNIPDLNTSYANAVIFVSRLLLPLPHPVDPKSGHAKWNGNDEMLEVTLAMSREYDFVNFQ